MTSKTAENCGFLARPQQRRQIGRLSGGAGSLERTSLRRDFPVNRENTGKFCDFRRLLRFLAKFLQCFQYLRGEFPTARNREFSGPNRELSCRIREIILAGVVDAARQKAETHSHLGLPFKAPLLEHLRRVAEAADWNVNRQRL